MSRTRVEDSGEGGVQYRLCVLTHGRGEPLARTLASFAEHVTPKPWSTRVFADGGGGGDPLAAGVSAWNAFRQVFGDLASVPNLVITHPAEQVGFCAATARLWNEGAATAVEEWVFWLEHDFVFTRDIDLTELAAVLEAEPNVMQMALHRGVVNDAERAAGGYLYQYAEAYKYLSTLGFPWIRTTRNWTTNPSLFRSEFARRNPWPVVPECEGVFGFEVRERSPLATFGIWGDGDPAVEHVGIRTGFGY